MGNPVRIKTKEYTFFINGKNIFLHLNDNLSQNYVIQTKEFLQLDQYDYAWLVDSIYKKRIKDTATLGSHLLNKYRLVPTTRKL